MFQKILIKVWIKFFQASAGFNKKFKNNYLTLKTF